MDITDITDVALSATARDAVLRLAHGARIVVVQAVRGISIGTKHTGYTTVRRPVFDRLIEVGFIAVDEPGPRANWYGLTPAGQEWARVHLGVTEAPAAMAAPADGPAHPIERLPVCGADPVPFEAAPEVCDHCGNLVAVHPKRVDPATEQRITAAMWQILIALGGPHNSWGGGPDPDVAKAFRQHMAGCGIDWTMTSERPDIYDVGETHDSETNVSLHLMAGRLWCECGKIRCEQISAKDLTMGQLMWHVARIGDTPAQAHS